MPELPTKQRRIVEVALAERGNKEVPPRSNRGHRIDTYRPAWKQVELDKADAVARVQGKAATVGDPWCSWFATWVWLNALGTHPLGRQIGGCYDLALEAQRRGLWIALPEDRAGVNLLVAAYPGAAFVMLDKPLTAGRSNGHTGLVSGVSMDGWSVSSVEGNSGDGVREGVRDLRALPEVRGIVAPLGIEVAKEAWPRGLLRGGDLSQLGTR